MAGTSAGGFEGVYIMVDMEDRLVESLAETAGEFAHVECFDDERRSEVYTILQAMRSDSETHRATIELLARGLSQERAHA